MPHSGLDWPVRTQSAVSPSNYPCGPRFCCSASGHIAPECALGTYSPSLKLYTNPAHPAPALPHTPTHPLSPNQSSFIRYCGGMSTCAHALFGSQATVSNHNGLRTLYHHISANTTSHETDPPKITRHPQIDCSEFVCGSNQRIYLLSCFWTDFTLI